MGQMAHYDPDHKKVERGAGLPLIGWKRALQRVGFKQARYAQGAVVELNEHMALVTRRIDDKIIRLISVTHQIAETLQ